MRQRVAVTDQPSSGPVVLSRSFRRRGAWRASWSAQPRRVSEGWGACLVRGLERAGGESGACLASRCGRRDLGRAGRLRSFVGEGGREQMTFDVLQWRRVVSAVAQAGGAELACESELESDRGSGDAELAADGAQTVGVGVGVVGAAQLGEVVARVARLGQAPAAWAFQP